MPRPTRATGACPMSSSPSSAARRIGSHRWRSSRRAPSRSPASRRRRSASGRHGPTRCHMFTDLCGARIIGRTRSEVDALGRFVVEHFDDRLGEQRRRQPAAAADRVRLSLRALHRLAAPGHRLRRRRLRRTCWGLKAEIQLRTVAEHAYSDFGHDLTYKGAFQLPLAWERELAGAAATLEEVDGIFSRVEDGLREYATNYGRYLGRGGGPRGDRPAPDRPRARPRQPRAGRPARPAGHRPR